MRKRSREKVAILVLLWLLLVSGCTATTDGSEKRLGTPTAEEPTPLLPSRLSSPTVTLTKKPTSTQVPIASAIPTRIQKPSHTLMPGEAVKIATFQAMETKRVHWMSVEVPATLQARGVQCKDGFALEPYPYQDILRKSNDQWTIFTCSPEPANESDKWTPGVVDYGTRYTQIIKTDLSKTWIIRHGDYKDEGLVIDRPNALLAPYRWTQDGKYVYFVPRAYPASSGFATSDEIVGLGAFPVLYRFNLETGDLETILPDGYQVFYAVALSPDDRFLVYSNPQEPNIVHVRNMISGDDRQIILDDDIAATGAFVWRPDSTKVVFASGYRKVSEDWQDDISTASIYVLTLKNMHTQIILFKDPRILIPGDCDYHSKIWLDEGTICLNPLSNEVMWSDRFAINIQTGDITKLSTPTVELEITSTPAP